MGGFASGNIIKKQVVGGLGIGKNEFNPLYAPRAIQKGFSGGGMQGFFPALSKENTPPDAPRPDYAARDSAIKDSNRERLKKARNTGTAATLLGSSAEEGAKV